MKVLAHLNFSMSRSALLGLVLSHDHDRAAGSECHVGVADGALVIERRGDQMRMWQASFIAHIHAVIASITAGSTASGVKASRFTPLGFPVVPPV